MGMLDRVIKRIIGADARGSMGLGRVAGFVGRKGRKG
jgi:hypothetical protein